MHAQVAALRSGGDRAAAVRLARQLRRIDELTPNEHWLLFRATRAKDGGKTVERYLRRLTAVAPSKENWARIALALWSEARFAALFAWSERHPRGLEIAARFLLSCANVSAKHREPDIARALVERIKSWDLRDSSTRIAARDLARELPSARAAEEERADRKHGAAKSRTPGSRDAAKAREPAETGISNPLSSSRSDSAKKSPPRKDKEAARQEAAKLRADIEQRRSHGDRAEIVRALRTLRRRFSLTPSEHRQLFRALRQLGFGELVDRYLRMLTKARQVDETRIALALWSEGRVPELLARDPAEGLLRSLIAVSMKHNETATALALLVPLAQVHPNDGELKLQIARLHLKAGRPHDALPFIEAVLGQVPASVEALELLKVCVAAKRASAKTSAKKRTKPAPTEAQPPSGLAALEAMIPKAERPAVRERLEAGFIAFLETADMRELGKGTDDLAALAAKAPVLVPHLAKFYRDSGDPKRAIGLYLNVAARRLDTVRWLDAARDALAGSDNAMGIEFCRRAAARGSFKGAAQAGSLLLQAGLLDAAIAVLSSTESQGSRLRSHANTARVLFKARQFDAVFDNGIAALTALWPYGVLSEGEQDSLVELVRLVVRAGLETQRHLRIGSDWLEGKPRAETALALWVDAMIRSALLDREGALALLERALELPPPYGMLDIRAEIALLHVRYRRFGDAARSLDGYEPDHKHYARQLEPFRKVAALCDAPEFYPECVIDVIFEEILRQPFSYEPEPGHLVTISGSLAQGGSERQTVNIIEGLTSDPRVGRQSVLIRSIENEDGFFMPTLEKLDIARIVYGENWREVSDVARVLPELGERPRLLAAIDLLPHVWREELVRLCRLLWDIRPEAAHVRQDLFASALACAIAGVPTFFIHRGSLARNTWDHSLLQADTILRPMRHTYRKLFEHTDFFLINNSNPGRVTDRDWIEWPDDARFHVVHNAVDFAHLGESSGHNETLRSELGIPPEAPVVGGVFRLASVKRPMLWIETAAKVLAALPNAHFIIAGDFVDYGDDVQAYARAHGFADRLHMPGAVVAVGDWYRAMDLVLLTSDREGLPNVLIEAQHFGLPVVSSDVGGAPETFEDGVTGFLVPPHAGADAFAARVVQALSDNAWRARAAARGPAFVHQAFGTQQALDRLIALYRLTR